MFLDTFIHKLFKMHVSIMYSAHNCSETHQPPAIEISTYFYSTTNIFITIYYLLILILFEKMPRISVDNIYSSSRQVRKWSAQIVSKLLLTSHGIISSPFMTQGGPPCKQQNCAQGGPPCASYLLHRAVRHSNSKMVHRADSPVHHICYAGQFALLTANRCAGRTALCII